MRILKVRCRKDYYNYHKIGYYKLTPFLRYAMLLKSAHIFRQYNRFRKELIS